jgi:LacI family transcriptional regulator
MVSQRDIAERAGVSVMTVSRVLRGERYVSPEIVQKVRLAAKELNYRPNPLVQSLMINRSRRNKNDSGIVIAWLGRGGPHTLADKDQLKQIHPYRSYFLGASEELSRRGFTLCDFYPDEQNSEDWERVERILRARNIQGILLGPEQLRASFPLKSVSDFSLVQIGRSRQHPLIDRVASDPFYAMQTCIAKLSEAGYQRIGYFDASSHNERSERRWEAAFNLKQSALSSVEAFLTKKPHDFSEASLQQYVQTNNLDALISGREVVGQWLQRIQSSTPLAFACLRLSPGSSFAGIETGFEYIGARAAAFLVDAIHSGRRGFSNPVHTLSIQGKWSGTIAHKPE